MQYKSYQHICRLNTDETEGILNGTVYVTTKLDGSNCCIFRKDDGSVGVGNRNRELTPIMDNHGCASYVLSEPKFKMFLDKHPDCMLFGEWLIKNHTKNYQRDAWHKVYVFDVMQQVGGTLRYVPYEEYVPWLEEFGIEYIPVVAKIDNPTEEDLKAVMDIAHFLQDEPGTQEGCFGPRARVLMADGSYKMISKIKPGEYVKSYNEVTKQVENKKVVRLWDNGVKDFDNWLYTTINRKQLGNIDRAFNVTKNHKIFNGEQWEPIESANYAYMYEQVLDDYRKQAIIGILCSDGCYYVGREYHGFSIAQVQSKVNDWLSVFSGFATKPYIQTSGKGSTIVNFNIKLRWVWYWLDAYIGSDGKIDYVSVFNDLDDIGWAYMFMGDGNGHRGSVSISLASYTESEVSAIKTIFDTRFGVSCSLYYDKRVVGGSGAALALTKEDSKKFVDRIGKYVLPVYRYKLSDIESPEYQPFPEYRPVFSLVKKPIYSKREESTMYRAKSGKYLGIHAYDLEVEGNHNYFVENMLVHNCVLKNYQYRNKYGRQTWAKIVREEYNQRKYEKQPKGEHELEQAIVDKFCTDAFIEKEYAKLSQDGWNSKMIPRLLGTIWHEFVTEESWNFVKEFKNPTIDFKVLNRLVIEKVKTVKGDLF